MTKKLKNIFDKMRIPKNTYFEISPRAYSDLQEDLKGKAVLQVKAVKINKNTRVIKLK